MIASDVAKHAALADAAPSVSHGSLRALRILEVGLIAVVVAAAALAVTPSIRLGAAVASAPASVTVSGTYGSTRPPPCARRSFTPHRLAPTESTRPPRPARQTSTRRRRGPTGSADPTRENEKRPGLHPGRFGVSWTGDRLGRRRLAES